MRSILSNLNRVVNEQSHPAIFIDLMWTNIDFSWDKEKYKKTKLPFPYVFNVRCHCVDFKLRKNQKLTGAQFLDSRKKKKAFSSQIMIPAQTVCWREN